MKVCVPPVRERFGDLTGCTGATMEDGRVYRANHLGHMTVDPTTARQMVANPAAPGMVAYYTGGVPRVAGTTCGACGFSGFPFHRSAACPRCGCKSWEPAGKSTSVSTDPKESK